MDVYELTLQTLERIMKAGEGMSIMLLDDHTVDYKQFQHPQG
jgi:hypothetical protein